MRAGEPVNPLTKPEPIHKLFKIIHLRIYLTQPTIVCIVLVRILNLSFTTRELIHPIH